MFRTLALSAAAALSLLGGAAMAAGGYDTKIENIRFSFQGPFGTYDPQQLQRGLQVYTESCASCHGLKFVPFRTLADDGGLELPEEVMRAYAAQYEVYNADEDEFREAGPVDHFPESSLENAPDLSLMAKKRAGFHGPYGLGINQFFKGIGGPQYIYSILTGYNGSEKEQGGSFFYGNDAFGGGYIAMQPPLFDGMVEFADGSPNDVASMAEDVSAFLMWTAEPKMMARKQSMFVGVLIMVILATLLFLTNKRIWAPIKGKELDL